MSTRRERAEARERRRAMGRRYHACFWCKRPVVAGQADALGRPGHYCCQLACWRHRRFHDRSHANPQLPQLNWLRPEGM